MFRKLVFVSIFILIISCDFADLMNSYQLDCQKICSKKNECGAEVTEDINVCIENCNKLIKYGYYQDEYGKQINDCFDLSCSDIKTCISKTKCKEPDYDQYVQARCRKFDSCGNAINVAVCLLSGEAVVKSDIESTLLRCSTDKLYENMSNCIYNLSCEYIEYTIENCTEYYSIMYNL